MEAKKVLLPAAFAAAITASVSFIGPEEGLSLKSYQDSVKIWTICRGHTGPEVKKGLVYTNAMCDTLFRTDIWKAMSTVLTYTKVDMPEGMLVAMTSFTFNVGGTNYRNSTMLKLINAGKFEQACNQLPRWRFAGGLDCAVRDNNCYGVYLRRYKEQELCLSSLK